MTKHRKLMEFFFKQQLHKRIDLMKFGNQIILPPPTAKKKK